MTPTSLFKAGGLAIACASSVFATYTLEDNFSGAGFFDNFDFMTVCSMFQ